MFTTSESTKQIFPAYVKAWAELDNATKNATNPHLKNKYADIAAVLDALKDVLKGHGLAVMQPIRNGDSPNSVTVTTILVHESGEFMSQDFTMSSADSKPQSLGTVITYARRYALTAFFAFASEDDDGNAGSGVTGPKQQDKPKPQYQPQTKPQPSQQSESAEVNLEDSTSTHAALIALGMDKKAYQTFVKTLLGYISKDMDLAQFVKPNADLYTKLKNEGDQTVKQFNQNPASFANRLKEVYAKKGVVLDDKPATPNEAGDLLTIASELAERAGLASGEVLIGKIRQFCGDEEVSDSQLLRFFTAFKADKNAYAGLKASVESGNGMAGFLNSLQ